MDNPCSASAFRYIALLSALLAISTACSMLDYSIKRETFSADQRRDKSVGIIYVHYADKTEPYEISVNRIRRGYAVQAPLYDEKDVSMNFTASRTRDSGNFIGLRGRLSF